VALVLVIVNDGTEGRAADARTGAYSVEARINRRVLATARVEAFARRRGWRALLAEALAAVMAAPEA
jgi:hypothetical protein